MDKINYDLEVEKMYHPENFDSWDEVEQENEDDFESIGGMDRF